MKFKKNKKYANLHEITTEEITSDGNIIKTVIEKGTVYTGKEWLKFFNLELPTVSLEMHFEKVNEEYREVKIPDGFKPADFSKISGDDEPKSDAGVDIKVVIEEIDELLREYKDKMNSWKNLIDRHSNTVEHRISIMHINIFQRTITQLQSLKSKLTTKE